ncbi:sensor histidine kinase [Pirellulaceae bacterium SH467]
MKNYLSVVSDHDRMSDLELYIVELELEIDRLRRRDSVLRHALQDCLMDLKIVSRNDGPVLDLVQMSQTVSKVCEQLNQLFEDWELAEELMQHLDSIAEIPVGRFVEKVFRFQQKLHNAKDAILCIETAPESIEWFPARLLHIVDNIISNSMRYRDPNVEHAQVTFALRVFPGCYEIQVSDNGVGIPEDAMIGLNRLSDRSHVPRAGKLGVGLAVVRILVENCCGEMHVESVFGRGTCVRVQLPRFSLNDGLDPKIVVASEVPMG